MQQVNSFHDIVQEGSNVVQSDYLLEKLQSEHPNFDIDEFNKDIREIDFKQLANTLDMNKITAKMEVPEQKGNKTKGTGIQSFQLKSGDILGIGNKSFQKCFMICGIKSFFSQHSYKFGDDEQKQLLKKPLNELLLFKSNMTFGEFKKLMTFQLQFQLFSQEKLYQSDNVIQQIKYLMLIKEVIGKIIKDDVSIKTVPQYKINGFIQEKYNDFCKDDITNLTVNVEIVPKFGDGLLLQSIVMYYNDAITGEPICNTVIDGQKSLEQIMNSVQMKPMDIVVYIDNCTTKKVGKEVTITPKLQTVNIVLAKQLDEIKPKGHGLNLQKFQQIINK